MLTAYRPDGSSVEITEIPAGLCFTCDSLGYRIVPCARDDPDRLIPDCQVWAHLTHMPHDGCGAAGCQTAVKKIPCLHCTPDKSEADA